MAIDLRLVLEHTRDLQRATSVQALLEATRDAVRAAAGYENVWLALFEKGPPVMVRLLAISGAMEAMLWERAPTFPVGDDPMLNEILSGAGPVVVADARTDPRTDKAMVAKLGNRTIINVPLLIGEENLGALGIGTFGDEGIRPPSSDALEHLCVMATHLAAAVERVRLLEEHRLAEREREELRRRLVAIQRIESLALLAGGIAHDFNNVLTVVSGTVRFALEDVADPALVREDLAEALEAIERASALTRQLLAMGRQQQLELAAVDVNAVLERMVGLLRRLLPENIELDFIPAAKLPAVHADSGQLDQVFMNLCLNARDALASGGRLTLETEQVVVNGAYVAAHPWARPGRYVLITVTDTGEGMPPEVRERVFEPFFSTKPASSGTGLGLAVTAGVIEQHGGLINCYSEVGVGTTFKVYLPAHERLATAVGTKLQSEVPRGHERILVAEDDPAVRGIVRRILTGAGYEVVVVPDGRAAIDFALAEPFALILLDAVMPGASGREAYERIRERRPEAAFLFSSGHARDLLPTSMLIADELELVHKPYHPDVLLEAVRRVLDRRRERSNRLSGPTG